MQLAVMLEDDKVRLVKETERGLLVTVETFPSNYRPGDYFLLMLYSKWRLATEEESNRYVTQLLSFRALTHPSN